MTLMRKQMTDTDTPDGWIALAVCQDCLIVIANDDWSGIEEEYIPAIENGLEYLYSKYEQVVADGEDLDFSPLKCDCCDGLPGDRHRFFVKER